METYFIMIPFLIRPIRLVLLDKKFFLEERRSEEKSRYFHQNPYDRNGFKVGFKISNPILRPATVTTVTGK